MTPIKRLLALSLAFLVAASTAFSQSKIIIHSASTQSATYATVSDITSLQAYVGVSPNISVTDAARGGMFKIFPSSAGLTINNGIVFHLNDGRYAVRDISQATGIDIRWFGAVADYNTTTGIGTDSHAAIEAAIAVAGINGVSRLVRIPTGIFFSSDSISVKKDIHIQGEQAVSVAGSAIYFASGKNGIVFHSVKTPIGTTTLTGADNSEIDHITLNQAAPLAGGHAIIEHAPVYVHDMFFNNWAGYAVYINAGTAPGQAARIRDILVYDRGLNYSSAPTITFGGPGSGASATAIVATSIKSGVVSDSGRAYYNPPTVTVGTFGTLINEGSIKTSGFGASATATMGVDTIWFPNPGSGYTTATLTITGSTAPFAADPAVCQAFIGDDGTVDSIAVLYGGGGYGAGTGVVVVITDTTGGTGATATATIDGGGHLTAVTVTDGGENYSQATVDVDITGGSLVRPNAHATAIISGGQIIGATITSRGRGYATAGAVNIAISGDGTGATATATLQVVGITITSVGGLYEFGSTPTLFFSGGRHNTGHDATGTTTLQTLGKVKRVVVNATGVSGYTTASTVTFSGGGATADAKGMIVLWGDGRLGNANRWKCKNLFIDKCLGGIYTEGSDANAGYAEEVKVTNSRWWAFWEGSFLGNTYVGCHTATNLGAYIAISNTGYNTTFYNCYSEGGQLPSPGAFPAKLFGGDHGAGIAGGWVTPITSNSGSASGSVEIGQRGTLNTQTMGIGSDINNGEMLKFYNNTIKEDLKASQYLVPASGTYELVYGPDRDDATKRGWIVTGPYTNNTFGHTTGISYSFYADRFRFGNSLTNGRLLTNGTAMPTSGGYSAGDIVINMAPNNSSKVFGWLRITTGTNHVLGTDWLELRSAPSTSALNSTSITSSATPTPPGDAREDELFITALAADATVAAPSGSPTNGNELLLRIKDDGTGRALSWDAIYRATLDIPLPSATTTSKTMYLKFKYNSVDSKWDLLSTLDNF